MKPRLPRLVRLVNSYLRLFDPRVSQNVEFMERTRLKGKHLGLMRKEVERITERRKARAGFTLVEMLVAVGLVLLMMSLFATIFQMATQTMQTQKGMAENDQKVRLVLTVLRGDLNAEPNEKTDTTKLRPYRTFRKMTPYTAGEDLTTGIGPTDRQGYFYLREGNPDDATDDMLQLTVQYPAGASERFWGAARYQLLDTGASPEPNPLNQPVFDDSDGNNNAAQSRMAEVSYFVRAGTLYRRVLLIREPAFPVVVGSGTPTDSGGTSLQTTEYETGAAGTRNFYTDFDFAAFYDITGTPGPRWHGSDNLSPTDTFSIGKPSFRFGFNHATGLPREFIGADYIGRFTQRETSFTFTDTATTGATSFGYPGRVVATTAPNPYDTATTLTYANGVVTDYENGTRIGEDVLMTGVTRFDIKVWDQAAGKGPDGVWGRAANSTGFDGDDDGDGTVDNEWERGWPGSDDGDWVDIGRTTAALVQTVGAVTYTNNHARGFYGSAAVTNAYFSPVGDRRWDSWNPQIDFVTTATMATPADGTPDPPPFGAAVVYPYVAAGPSRTPTPVTEGLKAIKITVTFFDRTTEQLRDVSLVQSLVYP